MVNLFSGRLTDKLDPFAGLLQFLIFLRRRFAFDGRDAVDKDDSVAVVCLVQDAAGCEAIQIGLKLIAG